MNRPAVGGTARPSRSLPATLAAAVLALGGAWFAPAHASAGLPVARALTVISGSAGSSMLIQIPKPTSFNNAGSDVKLISPGSGAAGVGVVRIDHHQRYALKSYYIETYGTDLGLCGGPPCPVPLPIRAYVWGAQDDGPIRLTAGDYLVVLLGEPGRHVEAHLRLQGQPVGTLKSTALGPRDGHMVVDQATGSVDGHDLVARGYHEHYAKSRLFAGQMGMFAFRSPGTLDYQSCTDFGDGPPPQGPTPCMGGGGAEPQPYVAADINDTVIGTASMLAYGPPDGHYNMGYTISVSGPDPSVQRIRVADYQIVLGQ